MKKNIVKLLIAAIVMIVIVTSTVACGNKQIFDTTYRFEYAYVTWHDGTSEKVAITGWTDYEDGDSIQITIKDRGTFLFHASDCILGTK